MPSIRRNHCKPTTNQRVVAESLSIARQYGFREGLAFFSAANKTTDPVVLKAWLTEKCKEQGIIGVTHG